MKEARLMNGMQRQHRQAAVFWHNIAWSDHEWWWAYLRDHGQVAMGNDNRPGDKGEQALRRYISGDRIVAYASNYGAVGWAVVEDPSSYRLVPIGSEEDVGPEGGMRHRVSVTWHAAARALHDAVLPWELREKYGLNAPRLRSQMITDQAAALRLLDALTEKFGSLRR